MYFFQLGGGGLVITFEQIKLFAGWSLNQIYYYLNIKVVVNSFEYFNSFMDSSFIDFVATLVVTTPTVIASIMHFVTT